MKIRFSPNSLFLFFFSFYSLGFGQYHYNNGYVVTLTDESDIKSTFQDGSNDGVYWYNLIDKEIEEVLNLADNYYNYKFRFSKWVGNPDNNEIKIYFKNVTENPIEVLESPLPQTSFYTMESTLKTVDPGKSRLTRLYFNKEEFQKKAQKDEPYVFFVELRTKTLKSEYVIYSLFFHIMMQQ